MALLEYIPTQWVNGTAPAINAVKLNHIENGIKEVTDDVILLQTAVEDLMPVGAVIMYSGAVIPSGWAICDGTQGTPNLVNKFVRGGTGADNGDTGGYKDAAIVSHSHAFIGSPLPVHAHNYTKFTTNGTATTQASGFFTVDNVGTASTTVAASAGTPSGTITSNGVSGVGRNLPPYVVLAYIMKLS